MSSWTTYPKLLHLGHPNLEGLFAGPVTIEEKVDGSQFSFGLIDGKLRARSKNVELNLDAPPDLFEPAVATVKRLHEEGKLIDGYTYRGEAFKGPKHNTLVYDRAPAGGVILFDVATAHEAYMDRAAKEAEAARIGLELVPVLFVGAVDGAASLNQMLDRVSCLGGQKIEGIVIKTNARFGVDGKPLIGKLVSEGFKEVNNANWKDQKVSSGDIIDRLAAEYATVARWNKAVQHLRDAGTLENAPKDIGALMKEVTTDVLAECREEIEAKLFKWAWEKLHRRLTSGLPVWYKDQLVLRQFDKSS